MKLEEIWTPEERRKLLAKCEELRAPTPALGTASLVFERVPWA